MKGVSFTAFRGQKGDTFLTPCTPCTPQEEDESHFVREPSMFDKYESLLSSPETTITSIDELDDAPLFDLNKDQVLYSSRSAFQPLPRRLSQEQVLTPLSTNTAITDLLHKATPIPRTLPPPVVRPTGGRYSLPLTHRPKLQNACVPCHRAKARCGAQRPCPRCVRRGCCSECIDRTHAKMGRPRRNR